MIYSTQDFMQYAHAFSLKGADFEIAAMQATQEWSKETGEDIQCRVAWPIMWRWFEGFPCECVQRLKNTQRVPMNFHVDLAGVVQLALWRLVEALAHVEVGRGLWKPHDTQADLYMSWKFCCCNCAPTLCS